MPSANHTVLADPAAAGTPPPSVEGGEQRCFRNLFVCTGDLQPSKLQLHAYGQHIAAHYNASQLVRTQQQQQPPAVVAGRRRQQGTGGSTPPPVSVLRQLGAGGKQGVGEEV